VTRMGSTGSTASIGYTTSDGTAQQRKKYIPAIGTLTFAAGQTSRTFSVLIEDNLTAEGNQTVNLLLEDSAGSGLNSPGRAVLTIATQRRHVKIDLGVLEFDDDARITRYIEKPEHSYDVSMCVYVYEPAVLGYIVPGAYLDFPDLVLRLLAAGQRVCAYVTDCLWLDIGRPDDYGILTMTQEQLDAQVMAAHRAGLKTVVLPEKNLKDLIELPKTAKSELKIIPVKHMDEVLQIALASKAVIEPPRPRRQSKEDLQDEGE